MILWAHGPPPARLDALSVLKAWPFDPLLWLAMAALAWVLLRSLRAVPSYPAARRRWLWGGYAVLMVALASPLAAFADWVFWVHMVQHLLVTLVAAPMLLLGAPLALFTRASSPRTRRRIARVAHGRVAQALTHPFVAWSSFTLAMWLTHFTGLYDAALANQVLHGVEHVLYLAVALLFWWPVIGLDPGARRLGWPARIGYLIVAIPQQSFLGLAIYSSKRVLYANYESLERSWGPAALSDQRIAGMVMWIGGDFVLLACLIATLMAWMRADEREAHRIDRRLGLS